MYFFFIVVYKNSVNLIVKYIFCILFPPTTLQLGIYKNGNLRAMHVTFKYGRHH